MTKIRYSNRSTPVRCPYGMGINNNPCEVASSFCQLDCPYHEEMTNDFVHCSMTKVVKIKKKKEKCVGGQKYSHSYLGSLLRDVADKEGIIGVVDVLGCALTAAEYKKVGRELINKFR